jgi:hypothetical protein
MEIPLDEEPGDAGDEDDDELDLDEI